MTDYSPQRHLAANIKVSNFILKEVTLVAERQ